MDRNFDESRLNVEMLLSHVLGLSRIELYMNFDRPLSSDERVRFKSVLQRRLRHEPLQYIIGETEFMGLKLFVDQSVLIPRPETEVLVEEALKIIQTAGKERVEVLDIGTGSGNISVALAHFARNVVATAIDISHAALQTAARNLSRHALSTVTLMEADIFCDFLPGKKFDIIVSNPPYVSESEFEILAPEIREFEPRIATCDNGDGFCFIRRICTIAGEKLKDGGAFLVEIAYNQSEATRTIVEGSGFTVGGLFADYSGISRVLMARNSERGS
jgi:release factor glutamine methyltransferase